MLPTVKPRGRWMALGSHWSEKEEGQSTKAICRHAGTPAEQGGSEPRAPGPCWEPPGSCSLHQSNRAEQGHSSICHNPQRGSGRPQIHAKTTAKGFFPQIMCKSHFSYHYFEMCMCHVLQRASGYKPLGVIAKPCWLLQLFGQPA